VSLRRLTAVTDLSRVIRVPQTSPAIVRHARAANVTAAVAPAMIASHDRIRRTLLTSGRQHHPQIPMVIARTTAILVIATTIAVTTIAILAIAIATIAAITIATLAIAVAVTAMPTVTTAIARTPAIAIATIAIAVTAIAVTAEIRAASMMTAMDATVVAVVVVNAQGQVSSATIATIDRVVTGAHGAWRATSSTARMTFSYP
jgi:hypothetical protein